MNRSQFIIVFVAALDLGVMLLFPPFDSVALGRRFATFDSFDFAFDQNTNQFIDRNLLTLEFYWVLINAAIAWLVCNARPGRSLMSGRSATLVFVAANLALVLLLPPFENFGAVRYFSDTYFDGFYFVFGDKSARPFYMPLLYMEIFWVCLNGALLWLLLRDPPPRDGQR
jgi:hypothetical protein